MPTLHRTRRPTTSRSPVVPSRRSKDEDRGRLVALFVLVAVLCAVVYTWSTVVTAAVLLMPLLFAVVLLSPRRLPLFVGGLLAMVLVETLVEILASGDIHLRRWVSIGVIVVTSAFTLLASSSRAKLGVAGFQGDAILLDVSERMNAQGTIPALPRTWYADVALRASGGTSFAGDFLVAHLKDERELSVVLVDVSGKGVEAGSRSMLLSGAFSGLLGALPPAAFLPAANGFLLRQRWDEGFATAIHLWLDLVTGRFELRGAGHPPASQYRASSGGWVVHPTEGPVLGIFDDASFVPIRGELGWGDAMLLYTDGLVERSRRDIDLGIDRMLGVGERLAQRGFEGSASLLVDQLGEVGDDCALVVLHRQP